MVSIHTISRCRQPVDRNVKRNIVKAHHDVDKSVNNKYTEEGKKRNVAYDVNTF